MTQRKSDRSRREPNVKSDDARRFISLRRSIVGDERITAHERRNALTNLADAWLSRNFGQASAHDSDGIALVAVGGYGRKELLPGSDLDVLLLHATSTPPSAGAVAERVFYPIWDAGLALDHSVRTPEEALELAGADMKVLLGLIDARHVAGDEALTNQIRADVRTLWRKQATKRLPELAAMVRERAATVGELAHLLEPDLVQAYGGLRDSLALRAVAASWIADQPHTPGIDEAREWLLVVRDALHRTTKRRHDRLVFEDQADVASQLGLAGPEALLRRVAEAGRRIAYASDVTWRSVDRALASRRPLRRQMIKRRPLADGVVEHEGEAVLARGAQLDDPVLPLRVAAATAQAGLPLGPQTLDRLVHECPRLPEPWPDGARDALVSLLGAGEPAIPVWESLDAAGFVLAWFPEWGAIRYLPTRTPVHRHTVDRHLIESAAVAAGLARRVSRPDLLLFAALFHDLGKRGAGDHSVAGETIVTALATRLGLRPKDTETLGRLVRHHLLLPEMATRRDPDDPATLDTVVKAVGDRDFLDLLAALTEADATAAGPVAWSPLRASLIRNLVARVRDVLAGDALPGPPQLDPWQVRLASSGSLGLHVVPVDENRARVTVAVPNAVGVVAVVAGALALNSLSVRAAHLHTVADSAVLVWDVVTRFGRLPDEKRLRHDIERALSGNLDLAAKLAGRRPRAGRIVRHAEPSVSVLTNASADATVLEVRAHDEAELLYRVAQAVADCGVVIRSAVIETLGAEAIDVFYLVGTDGRPVGPDDMTRVCQAAAAELQLS